jgi:hypothetical protein
MYFHIIALILTKFRNTLEATPEMVLDTTRYISDMIQHKLIAFGSFSETSRQNSPLKHILYKHCDPSLQISTCGYCALRTKASSIFHFLAHFILSDV